MELNAPEPMRDVMITISSTQTVDGAGDCAEFITQGKYRAGSDGVHFFYDESELTGLDGTCTSFFVTDDRVVMSREGSVTSRMEFQEGQRSEFSYKTPYGALNMALDTFRIDREFDKDGGRLEIEYDLDLDRSVVSRNRFKINVKEIEGN